MQASQIKITIRDADSQTKSQDFSKICLEITATQSYDVFWHVLQNLSYSLKYLSISSSQSGNIYKQQDKFSKPVTNDYYSYYTVSLRLCGWLGMPVLCFSPMTMVANINIVGLSDFTA